jgi:protein-tyrosine phosphatase
VGRDLAWDGCLNVRDLGGIATATGTTAFGVYVRADNVGQLSAAGWDDALRYGIRSVLDLRSEPERDLDPPPRVELVHERISLFAHFDDNPDYRADLLERVGALPLAERHRVLYREALDLDAGAFARACAFLAVADGAVLFHCVGGKDRTGLLAALILRLVDADRDAIERDYTASAEQLRGRRGLPPHANAAEPGVVNAVLDELAEQDGGLAGYLRRAGLPSEAVVRLGARLTALK